MAKKKYDYKKYNKEYRERQRQKRPYIFDNCNRCHKPMLFLSLKEKICPDCRKCGYRRQLKPYIFDNCVDCGQPILFVNPLQIRCSDCHKVKQELYIEICRTRYNFDRLCDTSIELAKKIEKEMIETDGEELRQMALDGIIKRKLKRG